MTTDPFVIVIALDDFSKAFDTVRHNGLLSKMALLDIPEYPDAIYNGLYTFTKLNTHSENARGQTEA